MYDKLILIKFVNFYFQLIIINDIADEHLHDDVDDADLSGDDRSIASDVQIGNVTLDHDSMDSDRGGALNLVCLK